MKLPAWTIAVIRTIVQAGVAALLGLPYVQQAIDFLTNTVGLDLSQTTLENAAFGVALAVVVALVNWIPSRFPRLGEWISRIFSLGTSPAAPEYAEEAPTTVVGFAAGNLTTTNADVPPGPKSEWGYAYDED